MFWFFFFGAKEDLNRAAARSAVSNQPSGLLLTLLRRALRVAFADFSAAPWQGFEKSERGPNNSSLFQPQAAVVVVALG